MGSFLEDDGRIQDSDYIVSDADNQANEGHNVCVNLAKVLLLLLNMLFLISGALVVWFALTMRKSGWLQIFADSGFTVLTKTAFLFVLLLGLFVIAISFLGCFGAWLRSRLFLLLYGILLAVVMMFFAVLAFAAHSIASTTSRWQTKVFPGESHEKDIGQGFNKLYCLAQVPYYCTNSPPPGDVIRAFGVDPTLLTTLRKSITDLCRSGTAPQLETLCKVCNDVTLYTSISDWTDHKCSRTPDVNTWCVKLLIAGGDSASDRIDGSPYAKCRAMFLEMVTSWGNRTMLVCVGSIMGMAIILVFVGVLCCNSSSKHAKDQRNDKYYQHHATIDDDSMSRYESAAYIVQPPPQQQQQQYDDHDHQVQQQYQTSEPYHQQHHYRYQQPYQPYQQQQQPQQQYEQQYPQHPPSGYHQHQSYHQKGVEL